MLKSKSTYIVALVSMCFGFIAAWFFFRVFDSESTPSKDSIAATRTELITTKASMTVTHLKAEPPIGKTLSEKDQEDNKETADIGLSYSTSKESSDIYKIALEDPNAALEIALKRKGEQRIEAIIEAVSGWAINDPQAAFDWVQNQGFSSYMKEKILANICASNWKTNPEILKSALSGGSSLGESSIIITKVLDNITDLSDYNQLAYVIAEIEDAYVRNQNNRHLIREWAKNDPQTALNWLTVNSQTSTDMRSMYYNFAIGYTMGDPMLALDWVFSINDNELKKMMLPDVISNAILLGEVEYATNKIIQEGYNSFDKNTLIALSQTIAANYPSTAISWANAIKDENGRANAMENIGFEIVNSGNTLETLSPEALRSLSNSDMDSLKYGYSHQLMFKDWKAAVDSALSISDESRRESMLDHIENLNQSQDYAAEFAAYLEHVSSNSLSGIQQLKRP